MIREIKFRAWDTEDKVMTEWEDLKDNIDFGKLLCNEYEQYNEYKLMQYTGLKDKDGKEIYEGDLVEHDDFDGIAWATYEPNEVVYDDEEGIVCFKNDSPNLLSYYRNLKVVGNIYENPDLLKGEPNAEKQKP